MNRSKHKLISLKNIHMLINWSGGDYVFFLAWIMFNDCFLAIGEIAQFYSKQTPTEKITQDTVLFIWGFESSESSWVKEPTLFLFTDMSNWLLPQSKHGLVQSGVLMWHISDTFFTTISFLIQKVNSWIHFNSSRPSK